MEEKIYDYTTGKSVKDTVKILKTNSIVSTGNSVGYPITWQVVDVVTEADGFQDNRKVKVGFFDADDDGVVDNPELFDIYVEPTLSESTKFVFFEKYTSYDAIERFRPYASTNFIVAEKETDINLNTSTYTDERSHLPGGPWKPRSGVAKLPVLKPSPGEAMHQKQGRQSPDVAFPNL